MMSVEPESISHNSGKVNQIVEKSKAIILDIEGTITAMDFVRRELYSYADVHLEEYIMKNWQKQPAQQAFAELQRQAIKDKANNLEGFIDIVDAPLDYENSVEVANYLRSIIANLRWQMANDRKTTGLKSIQGLIWRIGYEDGHITGHIYGDVIGPLEFWKFDGKDVYIYSSGSRDAQMYLLRYSTFGNLLKYFRDFFDTKLGPKLDPDSYKKICEIIKQRPEEVVFFTDRPLEICAAKESGLKTILVIRDEENPFLKAEVDFLGKEDGRIKSFAETI